MPKGFDFPLDVRTALWIPHVPGSLGIPRGNYLQVIGRLHDQATIAVAQDQLERIGNDVAAASGITLHDDERARLIPL
jgi:hypothetical protein